MVLGLLYSDGQSVEIASPVLPSYQLQGAVTSVKEVSRGLEVTTSSMVQAEAYSQLGDTW